MPEKFRTFILSLCQNIEEVIDNGDWPIYAEDDCKVSEKIQEIREYFGAV